MPACLPPPYNTPPHHLFCARRYENIVQIRCLLEGAGVDEMLDTWDSMLPAAMARWGLQRQPLVELFGTTRDDWIANDLNDWLEPNRIYEGIAPALQDLMVRHEVYIVTTKQAHFVGLILEKMAGIAFPPDRIFSQTVSGRPKSEVLLALQEGCPGADCFFVEDKFNTLEKVRMKIERKAVARFNSSPLACEHGGCPIVQMGL
jgi:hypothetical protein